jgi:radical SAM superfamily enzyme YgiQ (UPF0313 family)
MKRILLVNPPIFDFSAYDFWLRPFGLLRVAGFLRNRANLQLFDFLDRTHPTIAGTAKYRSDEWGKGKLPAVEVSKPEIFANIPRVFRRYGLAARLFEEFLTSENEFDYALVQTNMTYWYPGVDEAVRILRSKSPRTKIVLGGIYATICPQHAATLGADLVIRGHSLESLWNLLELTPDLDQTPYWEGYSKPPVGVLKLADGCPFRCTYCSVPLLFPDFLINDLEQQISALSQFENLGARNIVFYDDALLFRPHELLIPFLKRVGDFRFCFNFHTPNALNARLLHRELAELMVRAGFRLFYLGFESASADWQRRTGNKVAARELAQAVKNLIDAGVPPQNITAYLIIGHPDTQFQNIDESIRFARELGIRVMLSEFSPIPGTADGERCRQWVNLDEPLFHNKTAFTSVLLGQEEVNRLKHLATADRS